MSVHLFVLIASCIFVVWSKQCYWNSNQYLYYGSKTLYDDVRGDIRDIPVLEGCSPVSIWILARHGTRNPGPYHIATMKDAMTLKDDIIRSHTDGRGEICASDIENLRKWKWNDTIDNTSYQLLARGYDEFYQFGSRVNEKFLPLLEKLDHYYIRPTNEQRTKESAKAFVRGLGKAFDISDPLEKDEVLTPYLICPVHKEEVWFGNRSQCEVERYYETEEFTQMIADLQHRTGLPNPISVNKTKGMYNLCRFLRGYSEVNQSPWCALFSHQNLMVLDYSNDVGHYYRNGYGHPINPKLGHFALRDLYEFFKSVVDSSNRKLKAYFSHDSLLEMVYSALGLFRDYPEISGSDRIVGRKWRTSVNTPFAANIIAVLHQCYSEVSDKDPNVTSYKVQFFVNEKGTSFFVFCLRRQALQLDGV